MARVPVRHFALAAAALLAVLAAYVLILLPRRTGASKSSKSIVRRSSMNTNTDCSYLTDVKPEHMPPLGVWLNESVTTAVENAAGGPPTTHPKSLYLTILTGRRMDEWRQYWPSREQYLLNVPYRHQLLAVDVRDRLPIEKFIEEVGWTMTRRFTRAEAALDVCTGGSQDQVDDPLNGWYTTPGGATVAVMLRHFRRPDWMATWNDAQLAAECGPLRCCAEGSKAENQIAIPPEHFPGAFDYGLYTIAFTYHLIVDTAILDDYAFVFKLDADILFKRLWEQDMGTIMAAKNCTFGHTEYAAVSDEQRGCWNRMWPAMSSFSQKHGIKPASGDALWCNKDTGWHTYFYSNWLGASVTWLRAPAMRAYLHHTYHTLQTYWSNTFDQGGWYSAVCMFIPADPEPYLNKHFCDFTRWRFQDLVFEHY